MNIDDKNNLIKKLFECNCIKQGKFTLKNGKLSKYYYNFKNIISHPHLIKIIGDNLYNLLGDFDIICGVPYGALPIATYISVTYNKPMILLRDKQKKYGMCKLIEGEYNKNSRCVLIDDVITSGYSLQDAIDKLINDVKITKVIAVFNRQENYTCSLPVEHLLCKNDVTKYKLNKLINENRRLCFAADINNPELLLRVLENVGDEIGICKIHFDCIEIENEINFKERLIELSIKYDFLIMEDRKFVDISSIVEIQYNKFKNWVDLVTVHGSVVDNVLDKLSGALIVANMSNNNYDLSEKAKNMAERKPDNVIGLISQHRIQSENMYTFTPGISSSLKNVDDQNYRSIKDVDSDIFIVGRSIYKSNEPKEECVKYNKAIKNI